MMGQRKWAMLEESDAFSYWFSSPSFWNQGVLFLVEVGAACMMLLVSSIREKVEAWLQIYSSPFSCCCSSSSPAPLWRYYYFERKLPFGPHSVLLLLVSSLLLPKPSLGHHIFHREWQLAFPSIVPLAFTLFRVAAAVQRSLWSNFNFHNPQKWAS